MKPIYPLPNPADKEVSEKLLKVLEILGFPECSGLDFSLNHYYNVLQFAKDVMLDFVERHSHDAEKLKEGFGIVRELLEKYPNHGIVLKFAAHLNCLCGDRELAYEQYLRLIHARRSPDAIMTMAVFDFPEKSKELNYEALMAKIASSRFTYADEYFKAFVAAEPNHPTIYLQCAITIIQRFNKGKQMEDAMEMLENHLRILPDDERAWQYKIVALKKQQEYDNALQTAQQAIMKFGSSSLFHNERGEIFLILQNIDSAREDLKTALELNPVYVPAIVNRGILYISEQRFDNAMIEFNRAIEMNKEYATAWECRGMLHRLMGNEEASQADLKQYEILKLGDMIGKIL